MKFSFKQLAMLALATLFLAACGANGNSPEETNSLIIYSGRSESLVGPLIEQFKEDTGINVKVRYGGTAELAATLLEEGAASPADIFFAQDPGGLGVVADDGLLAKLPTELLETVDARFVDSDGEWVGVSGRGRVIVYNTDTLSPEDLPTDLWGFTDPVWRGRIGLPPTNGSFQTMVTAMRQAWGEELTREWLEGILSNNPTYYEKNTPTVAAVAAGEVEVGFVNHYYLYRFLAEEGESFAARNFFLPSDGPGSLVMVAGAGRLVTSPNEANALQFLEFLLSTEAQTYFATETYEYPLVPGIALAEGLVPLEDLTVTEIDLADLSDLKGTIELLQDVGLLP